MAVGAKKVFITKLTDVKTTDVEGVGVLRWEANKCYKWVKLANVTATVAVVAGDFVCYKADGYDVHTVVSDNSDADAISIGAGAIMGTVAGVLATSYYCWIQIKGPCTLNQALAGSPSAGDGLQASTTTTDKSVTKQLFAGTTPNIAAAGPRIGIAQDVANKQVVLDCPF